MSGPNIYASSNAKATRKCELGGPDQPKFIRLVYGRHIPLITNSCLRVNLVKRTYGIAGPNPAGANHLREHALAALRHDGLQAGSDAIHFPARRPGLVKEQNSFADFHFAAQEGNQIKADGFDVGSDSSWNDFQQTERGSVQANFLARNQADLAAARFAILVCAAIDAR